MEQLHSQNGSYPRQWIFLKAAHNKLHKVFVVDILYVTVADEVLHFIVAEKGKAIPYHQFGSLTALLKRLPPELFVRIDRDKAINILHLTDAEPHTRALLMSNEAILHCSRDGWKELDVHTA